MTEGHKGPCDKTYVETFEFAVSSATLRAKHVDNTAFVQNVTIYQHLFCTERESVLLQRFQFRV